MGALYSLDLSAVVSPSLFLTRRIELSLAWQADKLAGPQNIYFCTLHLVERHHGRNTPQPSRNVNPGPAHAHLLNFMSLFTCIEHTTIARRNIHRFTHSTELAFPFNHICINIARQQPVPNRPLSSARQVALHYALYLPISVSISTMSFLSSIVALSPAFRVYFLSRLFVWVPRHY